uniref:5'-deoxynucleotidase YfbR n=1 Tax=Arsenophonus endosymbiont of Trialeurodes vaporariorum TaxID=235567 RepID=A0A3B0M1R7_9GAMM
MMACIATYTNRRFNYIDVSEEDITLGDIAQGLSDECRFAGQIAHFYSVAQHAVYVSYLVPQEYALEALLHDATEAYCKDLPTPLKALLPEYKKIENRIDEVIRKKFNLPAEMSEVVNYADLVMLATERQFFALDRDNKWPILEGIPETDLIAISYVSPTKAKYLFIERYKELTGKEINYDAEIKIIDISPGGVYGRIYNDRVERKYGDGETINTSPVINYPTYQSDGFIKTINSVYRIIV